MWLGGRHGPRAPSIRPERRERGRRRETSARLGVWVGVEGPEVTSRTASGRASGARQAPAIVTRLGRDPEGGSGRRRRLERGPRSGGAPRIHNLAEWKTRGIAVPKADSLGSGATADASVSRAFRSGVAWNTVTRSTNELPGATSND